MRQMRPARFLIGALFASILLQSAIYHPVAADSPASTSELYFLVNSRNGNSDFLTADLFALNLTTNASRLIVRGIDTAIPAFSPDHKQIVVSRRQPNRDLQIVVLNR